MAVEVQTKIELQVTLLGEDAEWLQALSDQAGVSLESLVRAAILKLANEAKDANGSADGHTIYEPKVRPEVKRLREILARWDKTDDDDEAAFQAALANARPLSHEEREALAKRLTEGGVSSLDIIREREEGW